MTVVLLMIMMIVNLRSALVNTHGKAVFEQLGLLFARYQYYASVT